MDKQPLTRESMEVFSAKGAVLIEALPYIRQFEGKTIVVKYGGAAMTDPALRHSTAEDIVLMKYVGMNPVLVHGGGPAINRRLEQLNIESRFHQGLRVTDRDTIEVVEMVLAGGVNKEIVSLINRAGGNAVGISGKDANLLHAKKATLEDGTDVGFVGEVTMVRPQVIETLCAAGLIPVIAPIAMDMEGNTWNINADTAAGEIATALRAEKLVFLTDTPGILKDADDPASLIHRLTRTQVEDYIRQGIIAGGMIPKARACLHALEGGVARTHIIDGRVPHSMLLEFFTDRGVGTLVLP